MGQQMRERRNDQLLRDAARCDIAFVDVERRTEGAGRPQIRIATANIAEKCAVCVIRYPGRAPRSVIADQALMPKLSRGQFDGTRAAPGFGIGRSHGIGRHNPGFSDRGLNLPSDFSRSDRTRYAPRTL